MTTANQQIATTILKQMGGNKIKVMTGMKDIFAIENGLQFKLPANFAAKKINCVQVTLNANDTYDMKFISITKKKDPTYGVMMPVTKDVEVVNGVYCEQLQEIFTKVTGLDTHL